jgi:phosphatidylglycerophosphate synthase
MDKTANRRPLRSRSTRWAGVLTRALLRTPITPNAVSLAGIAFAAAGGGAFLLAPDNRWWWLAGALGIQLRLLANLLDGLVAIEGGRHSPTGALFNEFPDRIEDSLLLIAAGHAAGQPLLGWGAALMAMSTAYVRALGGAIGLPQDFRGPMAKQHRMAVLTFAAVVSAIFPHQPVMAAALVLICAGAVITCARRLMRQASTLEETAR